MKKILIPVIIFFVIVIGGIAFAVSDSYSKVQYGKDAMFHMMTMEDGGVMSAEYNGTNTQVVGRNTSRVYSVLTVSALKRVYSKPDITDNEAVYINFTDGAAYIIYKDPSVTDGVFIFYTYKGKKLYLKVDGYNSFTWIKKAISPSGIFNENIVLD